MNNVTITEHVWEQITNDENPQYACRNCGKQVSGWSKEEGEEMGIPDPCTLIQRRFASNAEDALVLTTRHRYVVLEPSSVAALRAHFVAEQKGDYHEGLEEGIKIGRAERMPEDVREIVDEAREFANHPEEHAEHDLIRRLADALEAAYSQTVETKRNTSLRELYPEPW